MRICSWWHPARGLDLPVLRWELKTRPPRVVVRLADGSGQTIPLSCTDAGGADDAPDRGARFTLEALLELAALVESFEQRNGG